MNFSEILKCVLIEDTRYMGSVQAKDVLEFRGTYRAFMPKIDKINWKKATGDDFFDAYLNNEEFAAIKGVQHKLISLSPEEYLKRAARYLGQSVSSFINDVNPSTVEYLKKNMVEDVEIDMPFLFPYMKYQEGRHRALAAKSLGVASIPVIVFSKVKRG